MSVGVVTGGVCKIHCYIEVNVLSCVNVMSEVTGGMVARSVLDRGVRIMGEAAMADGGHYASGTL